MFETSTISQGLRKKRGNSTTREITELDSHNLLQQAKQPQGCAGPSQASIALGTGRFESGQKVICTQPIIPIASRIRLHRYDGVLDTCKESERSERMNHRCDGRTILL